MSQCSSHSARGEPGRLPEDNEMPGLHLLRQEQHCEKQRMFTAKASGGHKLKPLDVSLLWVILLLGPLQR